jgi:hypothetical protein
MNKRYLLLLILPLLLVLVSLYLNNARGPYWLGTNSDPEYVYLLNSLNLAMMKGVGHIDHPGTPVQVLGAVVLRVVNVFSGEEGGVQADVLARPEFYLSAVNTALLVLNVLTLIVLGVVTYRLSGSLAAGLWLQAAPFLSPVLLQFGLTRVSPEPMLFFVSSLLALAVVVSLYMPVFFREKPYFVPLVWALVVGLGIAVKITFVPLAVIPLVFLRGFRRRLIYMSAVGGAFVVFTLPIIRMYPLFFRWVINLLSHSGTYGSGKAGLPEAGKYIGNIMALLSGNWFFTFVVVSALVVLFVLCVKREWRAVVWGEAWFRLSVGVTLAQVFGLLMVSKHASDHYLLPVFNLSGVVVLLLVMGWKKMAGQVAALSDGRRRKRLVAVFMVFIGIGVVLNNPPGGVIKRAGQLRWMKTKALALRAVIERDYKDYAKVFYYRSSAPEYAFKYGSDVSRSTHADALEQRHSGSAVYFYDIWTRKFAGFDYNKSISFETIRQKHGDKILFMGSRGIDVKGVALKEISDKRSYEGIFELNRLKQ